MRKFTSLLLLGFALGSFAQTPGGVSGSELWFKTAPLNSDLQGYYRWQDFSGDSIRLMLLDSRGVKSELTLPNSSVHYFNFNPSLWLADGFRSLSASLKHGDLSQATVIGVFAPELATIGKDMVVYALDGRKGDGAILSKDKAVRGRGVEPLDYGSASGEDLLYQSSDSLSENGFKESALRVVSYFKVSNPSTTLWGDNSNTTLFIGTPSTSGSFGTDFPTSLFVNASIRGYAPELIVFSRMLTPDERTVKTSGESDQVCVNSEFAGGRTNTAKFSLYVSPYLVANQGGRYTKHIYIGSQRVVSKIGDFDSYGSDPRRIQYAGSETDGLSVDYKQKYVQQLQVIKDNYATFAVPYNGEDNNDYVDGKGFCCNDGSLEAAQTRALARAAKNNFQEGDTYEKMQFYYHPDHLGSSSYITNLEGEVVQHIEYVPFGEVFIEERNSIWNTPYLFNAKEFDEETGLYYYGARYLDPRLSLWISTDPAEEKTPIYSTYAYCHNNPILLVDPDGAYPIITITKQKTGRTTWQRVIGWTYHNKDIVTRVNLYKVTVRDTEDKNYHMEFSVTRDAFTVRDGDRKGNHMILSNVAYEPKTEKDNHYTAEVIEYPKGNGTTALKLKQHGSEVMHADPNNVSVEMEYRNKADVAAGVMMHVGGVYNLDGSKHYAASEGCFGITNSDVLPSNNYTNDILNSIIKQSQKSRTNKNRIDVIIEKRNVNERPQTVNVTIK